MLKKVFVVLLFVVLSSLPLYASETEFSGPDWVGMGNDFLSSLGASPAALGVAADGMEIADIGRAVAEGHYAEALEKAGIFAGGKALSAVPVIGQFVAVANLGKALGDSAASWVGNRNFNEIYDQLAAIKPIDEWPGSYEEFMGEGPRHEFLKMAFIAKYKYLETYLAREYDVDSDRAERMAVEMILAKARFEKLCDELELEGDARTWENVRQEMEINAEVAAEIALEREQARQGEECNGKEPCEDGGIPSSADSGDQPLHEAPSLEEEVEAELVAMEQELSLDQSQQENLVDVQEDAVSPDQPTETVEEATDPALPLAWTIIPSPFGAEGTQFSITITNVSGRSVSGVSCSMAAVNDFTEGSIGWGIPPELGSALAPGEGISFTALAEGGAEGIALVFFGDGGKLGSAVARAVHEKLIHADGSYRGSFSSSGVSGSLSLSISGTAVTGSLNGAYRDSSQKVTNVATIKGTFDPKTGAISAAWSGTATGVVKYDGEKYDVNEPIRGALEGVFKDGSLCGTWSGGSDYVTSAGNWSAR